MSNEMRKPVRIALIGCGAVVQIYYLPALRLLSQTGDVQVTALFDPNDDAVRNVQDKFPKAVRLSDTAALTRKQADLAIIASPPAYHANQAVQTLEAGLSVLCEKPLATNAADAQKMVDAANSSDGFLAAGMIRRFIPAAETIRDMLAVNLLGPIRQFRLAEGGQFRWPAASPNFFSHANGGVLMDIGVHVLDLLHWWLGAPDNFVYEDDAMGGVEANCHLKLHYPNFVGEVRLSRDWSVAGGYEFTCEHGWIRWDGSTPDQVDVQLKNGRYHQKSHLHETNTKLPARNFEQSFVAQLQNVVAAVRGNASLHVPGADAVPSLQMIETCYAQRSLMPMPWLSPAEQQAAKQQAEALS